METVVEKRRSPRVDFIVRAKSISKDKGYQGSIENFSREGMMKTIPNGRILKIPSGETLNLECEVKWIRHQSDFPFGIKHHIGMEIQNPPQEYSEFVENLYSVLNILSIPLFPRIRNSHIPYVSCIDRLTI
jgi:hypothetical protein